MANNNSEYKLAVKYDYKNKRIVRKPVYIIKETKCFYYVVYVKSEYITDHHPGCEEHKWLINEPIDLSTTYRTRKDNVSSYFNEEGETIFYVYV
jgi:hypothetical protein